MITHDIGIIGGGNLGRSIAVGLLFSEKIKASKITVTRRKIHLIEDLQSKGIKISNNNVDAVQGKKVVIIAVEPHQAEKVLKEIKHEFSKEHILISVVTGIKIDALKKFCGPDVHIFRAMPNTAIAIRESMTCIATQDKSTENEDIVLSIFDQLGKTISIEEELMDASTVLAACGIAYALRFIRAASQGGIEIGFDSKTAQLIASQTVRGAAGLLIEGGEHPEYEIDKVTTPMGCTIAGLNEMEHQGFSSSLIKGILTSYNNI
jgi:pyrroline-5-carboxylate reductase